VAELSGIVGCIGDFVVKLDERLAGCRSGEGRRFPVQSVFAEGRPDGACWSGASVEVMPPEISFETGLEPHAAEGSTVDDGNADEDLTQPAAGGPVLAGDA
jgi:hypothetical protein